jgi:hypothetical protein
MLSLYSVAGGPLASGPLDTASAPPASDATTPVAIDISQVSPAHIAVFGGSGSRIAVFGGTGARTAINGMTMKLPTLVNGRMTTDRDPDEISWYGADITQELADRATTPLDQSKLILVLNGVALIEGPLIQTASVGGIARTYVVARLGGVDGALPADWNWIARVPCANGERFDKTTYFNKVDT